MDISVAKEIIKSIDKDNKYEAMIITASIITQLLEKYNIKPIVVGGLSVEIYTQSEYTTRDIDFVSDGYHIIEDVLLSLNFKKDDRHFYHQDIEIAVEIPDSFLAGSYDKVKKVMIDHVNYVYLISIEDIILDRLRATVHWNSAEDAEWGFKLLASNFEDVDHAYLFSRIETIEEKNELINWIEILKRDHL